MLLERSEFITNKIQKNRKKIITFLIIWNSLLKSTKKYKNIKLDIDINKSEIKGPDTKIIGKKIKIFE